MIEPCYTSVEVMTLLREAGIKTARDRVNRLADILFGHEQKGKQRRFSHRQLLTLQDAFRLIDQEGLPRKLVIALYTDPDPIFADLHDAAQRSETALAEVLSAAQAGARQFTAATASAQRVDAARRVDEAVSTIRLVRNLASRTARSLVAA